MTPGDVKPLCISGSLGNPVRHLRTIVLRPQTEHLVYIKELLSGVLTSADGIGVEAFVGRGLYGE